MILITFTIIGFILIYGFKNKYCNILGHLIFALIASFIALAIDLLFLNIIAFIAAGTNFYAIYLYIKE